MGKGRNPNPSASTAACYDDESDMGLSFLHVQVSVARRYIHCPCSELYMSRYNKQR
jgi:hypothetical protein